MKIIGVIVIVLGLTCIGLSGICLICGYPNDFVKLLVFSLLVTGGGAALLISGVRRDHARERREWEAMYRSGPSPTERRYAAYLQPNRTTLDDRRPEDEIQLDLGP